MNSAVDDDAILSPTLPHPMTRRETSVMNDGSAAPLIPTVPTPPPLSPAPLTSVPPEETENYSPSLLPLPALTFQTLADERQKDDLSAALAKIAEYERQLATKEETVTHLRRTVTELSKQLKGVAHFMDLREDIEERLTGMERRHSEELTKYKSLAKGASFDCLESKIRLKLEEKTLKETFEEKVTLQAEELLNARTKEIHQKNFELLKDKVLLSREVEDSRAKGEALQKENDALRAELHVLSSSEKGVLRRSVALKKQVEVLKQQIKTHDDSMQRVAEEFTTRLATQGKQHEKTLKVVTEERDKARWDALQCREEWKRLRAASSTMLSLQQDLHVFFHDALRQVRGEIVEEKRQQIAALVRPQRYLEGKSAPQSILGPQREEERKGMAICDREGVRGGLASTIPLGRRLAQKAESRVAGEGSGGPDGSPLLPSFSASSSSSAITPKSKGPPEIVSSPPPLSLLPPPLRIENTPTKSSIGRLEFQRSLGAPLHITYHQNDLPHQSSGRSEREKDAIDPYSMSRREGREKESSLRSSLERVSRSASERGRYSHVWHHPSTADDKKCRESGTEEERIASSSFSLTGGGVGWTEMRCRSKDEWGRDKNGFPVLLSKSQDPILKALLPPLAIRCSSPCTKAAEKDADTRNGDVDAKKETEREEEAVTASPEEEESRVIDELAKRWGASVDPLRLKDRAEREWEDGGGRDERRGYRAENDRTGTPRTEADGAPSSSSSDAPLVECETLYPASVSLSANVQERELRNIGVRQLSWEEKERVIYYLFKRLQQSPSALQSTRRVCRDHPTQSGNSGEKAVSAPPVQTTAPEGPSLKTKQPAKRIENKSRLHPPQKNPRAVEETKESNSSLSNRLGVKLAVETGVDPKTFLTQQ